MMENAQPQAIYLNDYQAPTFLIKKTDLVFVLEEAKTTVTSTLLLQKNSELQKEKNDLVLHGKGLTLLSISVDGRELSKTEYTVDDESLTLIIPDECIITCVTEIKPQENTSLEGLYQSSGMYCTQCEAEGFRKITYYLDRPDVMSEFSTKIIADKTRYPLLLSNGNLLNKGESDNNTHWAQWHDPFKKPSYLFALVAGDLSLLEDSFTTLSGREVALRIYVEAKDLDKCDHAMASLKQAMRWDEEVYGREYDLDVFMIVAVDDFNMGAMENKGLNIFNTSCVLAKPETTTDAGFQRVEAVVAHEYFHNWSGNRVTCRDWFQLSLKEGFTVFRDAEFSSDMGSRAVKRIEDVAFLRTTQFAEDAGPMAHPVQPPSFIEIANFYTLTIYEKGAEVVRMLHTLLGSETFREGSDLYFQRHDGQAVTINDFVSAMEAVSSRDLTQFKRWYTQAGTPVIAMSEHYDAVSQQYQLTVKQSCPDTPEATAEEKQPFHFPLAMGLVGAEKNLPLIMGDEEYSESATHRVLEVTEQEQVFTFTHVAEKPVASLFRQFSAPVRIHIQRDRADYLQLLSYDDDSFCRWDAAQQLAVSIIDDLIAAYQRNDTLTVDDALLQGLRIVINNTQVDKAMSALLLTLPSEAYLAEIAKIVDVDAIHFARNQLQLSLAKGLEAELLTHYKALAIDEDYMATAEAMAKRSLKNSCLHYLLLLEGHNNLAVQQLAAANNMTDQFAALRVLVNSATATVELTQQVLNDFYEQWKHETLVVNQWLSVQASVPSTDTLGKVKALMSHESFSIKNPNKVRALIGAFAQNTVAFHQVSGEGYQFLTEQIITLNQLNPQVASRMVTPLTRWKKYDTGRQQQMKSCLNSLLAVQDLSKDVYEVVSKSLS